MTRFVSLALAAALAGLTLSGCAEQIDDAAGHPYDPYESFNRSVYDANNYLDRNALRPVAVAYRDYVPQEGRTGVHNVLQNINTPYIFANEILQADFEGAGISLARIALNSTIGLAGLMDVAKHADLPAQTNGFGHTLAVYGVGHGPYLVLPLIGPSTPREAIGYGADAAGDPVDYFIPFGAAVAEGAIGLVDQRSRYIDQVDDLHRSSVDEYAAVRSIYLQQLEAQDRGNSEESGGGTADIPDYKDPETGSQKTP